MALKAVTANHRRALDASAVNLGGGGLRGGGQITAPTWIVVALYVNARLYIYRRFNPRTKYLSRPEPMPLTQNYSCRHKHAMGNASKRGCDGQRANFHREICLFCEYISFSSTCAIGRDACLVSSKFPLISRSCFTVLYGAKTAVLLRYVALVIVGFSSDPMSLMTDFQKRGIFV